MTPEALEEPNPFSECETLCELFGFIHRKLGEDGLRQLLAMGDDWTSESLDRTAGELDAVGLWKAAAIVAEVAANSPSETDLRFCPYPLTPENALNIKCWLRSKQQQLARRIDSIRR